jgi:hypothetical protein
LTQELNPLSFSWATCIKFHGNGRHKKPAQIKVIVIKTNMTSKLIFQIRIRYFKKFLIRM